ncbi:hypothetical protein BAUCODRAFT_119676 [Baudoinia panamericana UAMH 10762]|uniref:Zn(2)-C6 fungal-type domain-containing protein n=1 Tax=Baudoinia panamericana (strain UAMH 10762) TaxID=717646 RepID=M2N7P5_BAUPA|nr:uncharacterized protein BAUCODRAFT_119676 [Baudoinia panamericana UAMH 10762]EMD00124.1 hypothetical protein BAUCODRAFT_119676 [Baudoinia panamericana UAMH 10762]
MADSWMYQYSQENVGSQQPIGSAGSTPGPGLSAFREPSSPTESSSKTPVHRVRRRNRLITSCLECRRRKLKCDKVAPCTNCVRFKRDCLYVATADPTSQAKLADLKEKMGALERNLELEMASKSGKPHTGGANVTRIAPVDSHTHIDADDTDDAPDDEDVLEPTPLAALDNTYEDNGDDELMDLGVQMGKMRISERIGGWVRPKLVDELNDTLKDVTGGKSRWSNSPLARDHRDIHPNVQQQHAIKASPKSYIGPGPDYIAPASSFFFPGTNMNTSLVDYLPSKAAADQLVTQYFFAVHQVCRAVHRPTFETQYALFWAQIATGSEPVPATQAVVFAAMFSAAVSFTDVQVTQRFGTSKAALIDSLRSGTEMAMAKANFLRTTRVDVMQAFVMYLIPLVRAEVSRAHSALVGTAIRLAECMGLHRDGTHYAMSPVDVHVRRLLWHQLCFLDLRTCEATGPRPQIRPGDYDTKFPLNVNDSDLLNDATATQDRLYWTDATLFRIRAETVELRRGLFFDIVQIDKKKKSLTSTIIKIQKTWNALTEKYFAMANDSVPLQVLGKHVLTLGVQGCFLGALHRYLFSTAQRMPDRLRQILIEAGLMQMETAIKLETSPELAPWAWYRGAFNQYHSALLLMVEVYAYPMRKDAPRIWKCLDYIFDIPPHLSPKQKAELVITDLRDRMEVYHNMRKLRATTQMEERVSSMSHSALPNKRGWDVTGSLTSLPSGAQTAVTLPPMDFSPPPVEPGSSEGANSRHGSYGGEDTDAVMTMMDDIDWNEWDKYFPIENNSGELNVAEYDFASFTGGYSGGPSMDPSAAFAAAAAATGTLPIPAAQDLADVTFTPAYYPSHMPRGQPGL